MDTLEGIFIIGSFVIIAALLIGLAFIFWWFSGYLCTTFKWYDIDPNAQIITTIVMLTIGGSGAVRK